MFSLLRQPYPANESAPVELRKAALIGLFVGLFLVVFQPFGLDRWETPDKLLKIAGFGGITFLVTAFNFALWQLILPSEFAEERWTVGREIVATTLTISLIAVANWLYLHWLIPGQGSGMNWIGMLAVTFLIGIFPVTGLVMYRYIRQLKKYQQLAETLPVHPVVEPASVTPALESTIKLVADNEKDTLTIPTTDLLLIESSDNYCTVVYMKNGQPAKPLLRSSLSRLEGQIGQPDVVRCHRSFVVNLNRVERITGNAQGYRLHLLGGQFQIPVARQYNDTLVAQLKDQ